MDPEPSGAFDIIQPVLQYPGDEGNYWSVKSWYVTLKSGALASDEIKVRSRYGRWVLRPPSWVGCWRLVSAWKTEGVRVDDGG